MGYPTVEKREGPSGLNVKSIIIAILTVAFCCAVTSLITYFLAEQHFKNNTRDSDETDDTVPPTVALNDTDNEDSISASELRLPENIIPETYHLDLKIYLPGYGHYNGDEKNLTFDGAVSIQAKVREATNKVTLHSVELKIVKEKTSVKRSDGSDINIRSITAHEKLQMIDLDLDEEIRKEDITIRIHYHGKIRDDLSGLYQAKYADDHGIEKIVAVTQFEASEARKMVPCFDEPAMKANWTVSVIHPRGTTALGNGIEEGRPEQVDRNFQKTTFKTTPKMSSYLLAIFVSDFEKKEAYTKTGVLIRVWARKEAKEQTKYALEAGKKVLDYYEQYYGIHFPLEKQDMVAIPDFAAGAMENWGLVTYRETALLYDKNIFSPSAKLRVSLVIAHELAHQWFGNLVTMNWWDDLWLNEGFATFVEFAGTKEISNGELNVENNFVTDTQSFGFAADSVANSHPLSFRIDKVSEVREAFDSITYSKGASVIRMLKYVMGEDAFRDGLKSYLEKYAYSNAKAADLFAALNEKSRDDVLGPDGKRLDVVNFAEQWTTQMGFPLVSVSRENVTHVKISQERFKLNEKSELPKKYSEPKFGFKWDVPLWYSIGEELDEKFTWLPANSPIFIETTDAIVLNVDSKGFYRVNYDGSEWKKIGENLLLNTDIYSDKTKFRLIDDVFTMAKLGHTNYDVAMNLIQFIKKDTGYLPWKALKWSLDSILEYYGSDPERDGIRKYMVKLFRMANVSNSWDFISSNYPQDEYFEEVELATMLKISEATDMEDEPTLKNISHIFTTQVEGKCSEKDMTSRCAHSTVPAPLRPTVYCVGVKKGGKPTFEKMMQWYRNEKDQKERSVIMKALGCVDDATLLKGLLINAIKINGSDIRLQDMTSAFDAVSSNPMSSDFMLNFFIDRWSQIYEKGKSTKSILSRVVRIGTSNIFTRSQLEMFSNFRKKTPTTKDILAFNIGEESAEAKVEWREKHFGPVSKMFNMAQATMHK